MKKFDIYEDEFMVTNEQILSFSKLTGDTNPIHLDSKYCEGTRFRSPIVPGMLMSCIFSKIISTKFPGPGTIYGEQTLKFTSPVYPGDKLIVLLEVDQINEKEGHVSLKTTIKNGKIIAVEGYAKVFLAHVFKRPNKIKKTRQKNKESGL